MDFQNEPMIPRQWFITNWQTNINMGIPEYIPEALPWLKEYLSKLSLKEPGSTISKPLDQYFDWVEIRSQYEHYSDLNGWAANSPSTGGFTAIDSPNGWRAQDDEELSGVCIATTGLTQTTSELHQIVTMNSQTIGTTARTFLGQGDLLA